MKLGRVVEVNSVTFSCSFPSSPQLEPSRHSVTCKFVKCFIPIMKSHNISNRGTNGSSQLIKVKWHNFRHFWRAGNILSNVESPTNIHDNSIFLTFSAGSKSAKSSRLKWSRCMLSVSNWREFLKNYKGVSSVFKI